VYDDVLGIVSADHFYDLLVAAAAIDVREAISGVLRLGFIFEFLDEPFTTKTGNRLAHLYNSDILTNMLKSIIENESAQAYLADMANEQIQSLVSGISNDLDVRDLEASEFGLTYELFNDDAIRALLVAVENTGVATFNELFELTSITAIAEQLDLNSTGNHLMALIEVPLVHHVISTVLLNDLWSDVAAQYINNMMDDLGIDMTIEAELLQLDSKLISLSIGRVRAIHIYDLIVAAYTIVTTDDTIDPEYIQLLMGNKTIVGDSQRRIDHVLDSQIIKNYLDVVLMDEQVKEIAATYLNNLLEENNITLTINPEMLNVPGIALEDGSLKRTEIYAFLNAFNALNLGSFDELSNFGSITYVYDIVNNTLVVEKLFESKWVHVGLSNILKDEDGLAEVAELASTYLEEFTGVEHTFSASDFDLTHDKYGIFETSGVEEGLIKVSEIKQLILAGTRINWLALEFGGGLDMIADIVDALTAIEFDLKANIEFMLESKVLIAIFDKALNFEYAGLGLDQVVIDYANNMISEIEMLDGLVLPKSILHYDASAYDVNNVLKASGIIGMVNAVKLIDFSSHINGYTFYQLVQNDDFDGLFESAIVHSLLSNVLTNVYIRIFAVDYINDLQSYIKVTRSLIEFDPSVMNGSLI
ncbi:MAG: hypothetical protein IH571_07430, partial [Acholeplasmataceae bacterium]|nr:hypothetical protein [Acholeplasmataceae bacterium]